MKQKDIALIISVAVVAAVLGLIFSNLVISAPRNRQEKVEVVDPITAEFKEPDNKYFNAQSVDPTQLIRIGDNSNQKPFNGAN